ncbi:MAG: hypothetical protein HQL33_06910 [Alphaproteobacteria bacterium]|nr:hypothetical protein [Alphaproteobacteria bacterium]
MVGMIETFPPRTTASFRSGVKGQEARTSHEDAKTVVVTVAARNAGSARANTPLSLPIDLSGLTLAPGVVKAYEDAEAAIAKMQEGAKANAKAAKAARMAMAEAKLKALKIAAVLSVHTKNPKAARAVAEEAAKTARELKSLRDTTPGEVPPVDKAAPPDAPAPTGDGEANKEIDALIQQARKVIAIARKAARPGSADEQEMAALQAETGTPDLAVDVVTEKDLKITTERRDRKETEA